MKVIIIGAVAAGTSAGAKLRRSSEDVEIVIYEQNEYISYSGCGMPYYLGNEVETISALTPRDSKFFKSKYNIDLKTSHQVLSVNRDLKQVSVKDLKTGETYFDTYDKLVFATGATPFKPNISGIEQANVCFLRNINDMLNIKDILDKGIKSVLIVGSGFIGFELLENFVNLGLDVTIVERNEYLTPNLDKEMASYLKNLLLAKNLKIKTSTEVVNIDGNEVSLSNNDKLNAELIVFATGVKPNTNLAKAANIELGVSGAIKVNEYLQTNDPDIYACGDCIETYSLITKEAYYRPLGSTANKTGRIVGSNLLSNQLTYKGNLSTGIFKLFDLVIGTTGLNEQDCIRLGYDYVVCHNIKVNKPEYLGGKEMVIKAIADKVSEKILGVQIIGYEGVDKRLDVFATLITYGAKVDELFDLDLAYAPPFATTKDPVHYTGMILDNAINHNRELITNQALANLSDYQLVDVRSTSDYAKGCVEHAQNLPLANLRANELAKDKLTVVYCNKGVSGNAGQNILINQGFKKVLNLSGGHKFYKLTKGDK